MSQELAQQVCQREKPNNSNSQVRQHGGTAVSSVVSQQGPGFQSHVAFLCGVCSLPRLRVSSAYSSCFVKSHTNARMRISPPLVHRCRFVFSCPVTRGFVIVIVIAIITFIIITLVIIIIAGISESLSNNNNK